MAKVVRYHKSNPSPFLVQSLPVIKESITSRLQNKSPVMADLGAGNGRNLVCMMDHLPSLTCMAYDLRSDHTMVQQLDLSKGRWPINNDSVDLILCQYLLMFMDTDGIKHTLSEINRIASKHCVLVLELFSAKQSHFPNNNLLTRLDDKVEAHLLDSGWDLLHRKQFHILASK